MNIIYTTTKDPKLTLSSAGEIRVKLNRNISSYLEEKVLAYFTKVSQQIGCPNKTLRGKYFYKDKVFTLYTDSKSESIQIENDKDLMESFRLQYLIKDICNTPIELNCPSSRGYGDIK